MINILNVYELVCFWHDYTDEKLHRVWSSKTSKEHKTLSSANKTENTSGKHLFGIQVIASAANQYSRETPLTRL